MFTIQNVTNLAWSNPEHTAFSCDVKYEEFNETHPVGVNAIDSYPHMQTLWQNGIAGNYGVIAEYVTAPSIILTPEEAKILKDEMAQMQPTTTGTKLA